MTVDRALEEGYENVKLVKIKGVPTICGLFRFAFTTGLVIGIDSYGYFGRYCFNTRAEASNVLKHLESVPEDMMIPGNWIKFKGEIEFSNPKYNKDEDNSDGIAPELINMLLGTDKGIHPTDSEATSC